MKLSNQLNKKNLHNIKLKRKSFFEQGFTFLEFILVVSLLGLTARLIIPSFRTSFNKSRQKEASLIVSSMIKSSQSYYGIYGFMPKDIGQLFRFANFQKCIAEQVEEKGNIVCRNSLPIKVEKQDELNYAILMCGYEIVALMQPKNNELHPSDLLLILNFVNTQNSLRKSETWMPLCLPNFNPTGCLYGYCSYLKGASDVSLMLITTGSNPDNFHNFQQVKTRIETSLNEQGVMRAINTAHQRPNKTTAELRVPQVFHFVYACKLAGLSQCCSVAFSLPYITEDSQKKLLRRYQHVFHSAHGCMTRSGEPYTGGIIGNGIKDRSRRKRNVLVEQSNDKGHDQVMYDPNDIVIDLLPSEIVVGYVGEDIEVYFALSPLAGMDLVQSCLNKILRVMKREERTLFFLEKNTW